MSTLETESGRNEMSSGIERFRVQETVVLVCIIESAMKTSVSVASCSYRDVQCHVFVV